MIDLSGVSLRIKLVINLLLLINFYYTNSIILLFNFFLCVTNSYPNESSKIPFSSQFNIIISKFDKLTVFGLSIVPNFNVNFPFIIYSFSINGIFS